MALLDSGPSEVALWGEELALLETQPLPPQLKLPLRTGNMQHLPSWEHGRGTLDSSVHPTSSPDITRDLETACLSSSVT